MKRRKLTCRSVTSVELHVDHSFPGDDRLLRFVGWSDSNNVNEAHKWLLRKLLETILLVQIWPNRRVPRDSGLTLQSSVFSIIRNNSEMGLDCLLLASFTASHFVTSDDFLATVDVREV